MDIISRSTEIISDCRISYEAIMISRLCFCFSLTSSVYSGYESLYCNKLSKHNKHKNSLFDLLIRIKSPA